MVIGTRGSKLALWQANWVKSSLAKAGIESQLKTYTTQGDKVTNVPLHSFSTTGIFTKALDDALLKGEIDIAVHSAKDMASSIHDELEILAFLEREDPRDALLAKSVEVNLENFSRQFVIGTSSVRRRSFIQHYFSHITLKELRGNVDTRVQKMLDGEYDGIILALAGVKRMGLEKQVVQKLSHHSFIPAVGQGAVAVVGRKGWDKGETCTKTLNHEETSIAVKAERAFLRTLGGGCSQPVFGHALVWQNSVKLTCGKLLNDGKTLIREVAEDDVQHAEILGKTLAEKVLLKINQ
ncbi:MAG: hydroxymethylbilane synthase [Bacteroidia bacterium]|nr:hydroxymethylbilane synthase [Bacteroidia bacterium]